jgi:hypothetical protein
LKERISLVEERLEHVKQTEGNPLLFK